MVWGVCDLLSFHVAGYGHQRLGGFGEAEGSVPPMHACPCVCVYLYVHTAYMCVCLHFTAHMYAISALVAGEHFVNRAG